MSKLQLIAYRAGIIVVLVAELIVLVADISRNGTVTGRTFVIPLIITTIAAADIWLDGTKK